MEWNQENSNFPFYGEIRPATVHPWQSWNFEILMVPLDLERKIVWEYANLEFMEVQSNAV